MCVPQNIHWMNTRMLNVHIMEHKSRIKNKIPEAPLVEHFIQAGHALEELRFFAFFKSKSHPYNIVDVPKCLQQLEATWIFKMNSLEPHGLNQELDLSVFI